MSAPLLTTSEQQQVLEWGQQGIGPAEIARRLNRPTTNITRTYRQYVQDGCIPRRARPPWKPWTQKDNARLEELLDAGHSYDKIADCMGRTETSIKLQAKRRRHGLLSTDALTTAAVQRILGLGCSKTVVHWIERGWLPARNSGRFWRIQQTDLDVFLAKRAYWMAWHPTLIPDPELRAWAEEERRGQPRWLTPAEVAARYAVEHGAVNAWIQKGWLPATKYGNQWIWEGYLEGWKPPSMLDYNERKKIFKKGPLSTKQERIEQRQDLADKFFEWIDTIADQRATAMVDPGHRIGTEWTVGIVTLNVKYLTVSVAGGPPIHLQPRGYSLLYTLMEHVGRPRTADELAQLAWDWAGDRVDSNSIATHIRRLRQDLGTYEEMIKTARHGGYYLDPYGEQVA